MKHSNSALIWFALAGLVIYGCGGHNGSPGAGTGGSTAGTTSGSTAGTTGSSSFAMSGKAMFNGGYWLTGSYPAGTETLTLSDSQGDITAFKNIFVPLALNGGSATIIRAGSLLFKGTYTAATAQCVNFQGQTAPVPLNSDGTLAKDIAIDGHLIIPVSAAGALTFSNGIEIDPTASLIGNNTQDVTVTYSSDAADVPSGNGSNNLTGTIAFSGGGTANTQLALGITFISSNPSCHLTLGGTTFPPSRTIGATGQIVGSQLPFASGLIQYQITG